MPNEDGPINWHSDLNSYDLYVSADINQIKSFADFAKKSPDERLENYNS